MSAVTITEVLPSKTGNKDGKQWQMWKFKDSAGRTLTTFNGSTAKLLADNVGKRVLIEGDIRNPEYPNDVSVTGVTATGEYANGSPAPDAFAQAPVTTPPAPADDKDAMWREKERRTQECGIAKSYLEGDMPRIHHSLMTVGREKPITADEFDAEIIRRAARVAKGTMDLIWGAGAAVQAPQAPPAPSVDVIGGPVFDDSDSIPF